MTTHSSTHPRHIMTAVTVTALVVIGASCGSDDPAADEPRPTTTVVVTDPSATAPPPTDTPTTQTPTTQTPATQTPTTQTPATTTAPPTTVPPTTATPTAPPTTVPPTTGMPTTGTPTTEPEPDLPDNPIVIDDGAFASVAEMAAAADLVILGRVTDETSLGRPGMEQDPMADEFLGLTVQVDTVLKGDPVDAVRLGWDAFRVDESGQRVATNVMNGVPVPHVGDQLLLFLTPVDDQFRDFLGGFPTHGTVMLDGVAFVEDDTVTITDRDAPEPGILLGKTVDQIAAEL